jgi:hypothetical protein
MFKERGLGGGVLSMSAAEAGSVVFTADKKCRHRDGYDGGCIALAGGIK